MMLRHLSAPDDRPTPRNNSFFASAAGAVTQGQQACLRGIDRARERANQNALDRARDLEAEGEAAAAARAKGAVR